MPVLAPEIDYLFSLRSRGWKLGLDVMRAVAEGLGDPQRQFSSVLVAGTNGKGSCSAMLASILRSAGIRAGLYTSPHLVNFGERIRVDGASLAEADAVDLIRRAKPLLEKTGATFFEAAAAMSLRHFADRGVKVAVLEVGLGGRLDATNIVDPLVSVITGISMDHVAVLGRTRSAIAREKAGIIREGGRVITGATGPALETIEEICRERRARCEVLGRDARLRVNAVDAGGTSFELRGAVNGRWRTPLIGRHQAHNAACALLAARALGEAGVPVSEAAMRAGLESARWPARFEIVPGKPAVVLDVAHNLEGARALASTWREVFGARRPVLLAGMLSDKDYTGFARHVFPLAEYLVAAQSKEPRALPAAEFARPAARTGLAYEIVPDVAEAFARARERAGREGIVLVAGSLFTVGEAMEAMGYEGLGKI